MGKVRARARGHAYSAHTISRKSFPTQSRPVPPSRTEPSESSSLSVKRSESMARSATLLKTIFTSFSAMGGSAVDDPDELGAIVIALEDEPGELDEGDVFVLRLRRAD